MKSGQGVEALAYNGEGQGNDTNVEALANHTDMER